MPEPTRTDVQRGLAAAGLAYLWWGLSPLFWKQLGDVAAIDTVGWRVAWTAVIAWVAIAVSRRGGEVRSTLQNPRVRLTAVASAALLSVNWGVYVWAVSADRVVEASLGYFVNPLVSVFLGVVFLRESLRRAQWIAVALAALGVAWLTITLGAVPWVGLVLAGTFGLYGLVRKTASAGPMVGLGLEMAVLIVPAVVLLTTRAVTTDATLTHSTGTTLLLACTGVITAVPLVLFATGARRAPLSVVGLLQYITPTLQFLIGVLVYDEVFDGIRLVGYSIIWAGLAVFAVDAYGSTRSLPVPAAGTPGSHRAARLGRRDGQATTSR